jgi:hypothetical protein
MGGVSVLQNKPETKKLIEIINYALEHNVKIRWYKNYTDEWLKSTQDLVLHLTIENKEFRELFYE